MWTISKNAQNTYEMQLEELNVLDKDKILDVNVINHLMRIG